MRRLLMAKLELQLGKVKTVLLLCTVTDKKMTDIYLILKLKLG